MSGPVCPPRGSARHARARIRNRVVCGNARCPDMADGGFCWIARTRISAFRTAAKRLKPRFRSFQSAKLAGYWAFRHSCAQLPFPNHREPRGIRISQWPRKHAIDHRKHGSARAGDVLPDGRGQGKAKNQYEDAQKQSVGLRAISGRGSIACRIGQFRLAEGRIAPALLVCVPFSSAAG